MHSAFSYEDAVVQSLLPFSRVLAGSYTPGSGGVASFDDVVNPSHTYTQGVAGSRVAVPTADSSLRGRMSATFTGGQGYESSGAAAYWSFLGLGGDGFEIFFVGVPTSVASTDFWLSSRNTGNGLTAYNASGTFSLLHRQAGPQDLYVVGAGGLVSGTPTYVNFSAFSGGYVSRLRTTQVSTGALSFPPLGSAQEYPLNIAQRAGALTNRANVRLAEILVFDRVLSTGHREAVQSYMLATYGL